MDILYTAKRRNHVSDLRRRPDPSISVSTFSKNLLSLSSLNRSVMGEIVLA
jgi:hypothetical protein